VGEVGEVEILSSTVGPVDVGAYLHSLGLPTHHILLLNITGEYRLCFNASCVLTAHVTNLHKDKKEAYNIMT
jgi:hypothetical protein